MKAKTVIQWKGMSQPHTLFNAIRCWWSGGHVWVSNQFVAADEKYCIKCLKVVKRKIGQ